MNLHAFSVYSNISQSLFNFVIYNSFHYVLCNVPLLLFVTYLLWKIALANELYSENDCTKDADGKST